MNSPVIGTDDNWSGPKNWSMAQKLIEFAGRLCYRSWRPGLNPNVSKVRTDSAAYLANILKSKHGSVLEHANFSFVFHNVSRVFTHELVRHRAGVAISQESMRYVRLDEIPMWIPDWAKDDPYVLGTIQDVVSMMEQAQLDLAEHFQLDDAGIPFSEKKHKTSFMRRLAPIGVGTSIMWTANVRTLRHTIETRTAHAAEEEMHLVFGQVAKLMKAECPELFGDFTENAQGSWVPEYSKV